MYVCTAVSGQVMRHDGHRWPSLAYRKEGITHLPTCKMLTKSLVKLFTVRGVIVLKRHAQRQLT